MELPNQLIEEIENEMPRYIRIDDIIGESSGEAKKVIGPIYHILNRFSQMGKIGGRGLYMGPSQIPHDNPIVLMSAGFNYDPNSPEIEAVLDKYPQLEFLLEQNYLGHETSTIPGQMYGPIFEWFRDKTNMPTFDNKHQIKEVYLVGGLFGNGDKFELSTKPTEEFPYRQMILLRKGESAMEFK